MIRRTLASFGLDEMQFNDKDTSQAKPPKELMAAVDYGDVSYRGGARLIQTVKGSQGTRY